MPSFRNPNYQKSWVYNRVSELWLVRRQGIDIYQFQDERYILVQQSQVGISR